MKLAISVRNRKNLHGFFQALADEIMLRLPVPDKETLQPVLLKTKSSVPEWRTIEKGKMASKKSTRTLTNDASSRMRRRRSKPCYLATLP